MLYNVTTATTSPRHTLKSITVAAIPYAAVVIGLYILHNAWAAILLYHVGIIVVMATGGGGELLKSARSGWRPAVAAWVCAGTAMGGVFLWVLWPYVRLPGPGLDAALAEFGLSGISWIIFMVYYSTVHPFAEELIWRGSLAVKSKGPSWLDVAFGGYHFLVLLFFIKVPWVLATALLLSIAAWGWRYAAMRYGGLSIALVSHAVADLSIVIAAHMIKTGGSSLP